MSTVLWILQGVLACAFIGVGSVKFTQPKQKLETNMGWVNDFPSRSVKTIGLLEMVGGVGIILPGVLDVAPVLTAWAAIGLLALMIGAAITHARRREPRLIVPTLILAAVAGLAAWGRFGPYSL